MKRFALARHCRWALAAASLVALLGIAAVAEDSPGITVSATGVAEAMPEVVELTATVEGSAELAGDAVEKFRGNKRRVTEALNKLAIQGLAVVGSGLSVTSGTPPNPLAAFQAGQANQPKATDKVAVQERLIVTLSGISNTSPDDLLLALTRIIDVVKDAGMAIGPGPKGMIEMQLAGAKAPPLATFKLASADALRQQAYESALKQARAKAEGLAQLAGVELGEIVAIRETAPAPKDDNGTGGMATYIALFTGGTSREPEYTSAEFQTIPLTVNLSVQFAIAKKQ